MSTFIFMLTQSDATVANALEVYEQLRNTDLEWVGFKDVGIPTAQLRELSAAIQADGRKAVLEVVSLDEQTEIDSVTVGLDLGVDIVMGGVRPDLVAPIVAATKSRYFPFVGTIVGHPSILQGEVDEIEQQTRDTTQRDDVDGVDLLAYRHASAAEEVMDRVVRATGKPVVIAGSVDSVDRIARVKQSGAWGFTIGSAILDGTFCGELSLRERVQKAIEVSA